MWHKYELRNLHEHLMQFKDFHHLDTQAIVGQILEPQNIVSFGSSQKIQCNNTSAFGGLFSIYATRLFRRAVKLKSDAIKIKYLIKTI